MSSKLQYHFVPNNLNISELNFVLTGELGSSLITHKVLNFYTLIVKKLINNIFFDHGQKRYVFINHKERRCLLGDKYKETIELLVKANYLLENPKWKHYASGTKNHTKAYALPSWMLKGERIYKLVKILKNKSILNMIARFNTIRMQDTFCNGWREEMVKSSQRILLKDTEECRKAVQSHLDKVNRNRRFKLKLDAVDFITMFNGCVLDQSVVDAFGKRAHTKISRLPKTIRRFIFFENRPDEPLACVDIVNSQPVFMSVATPDLAENFIPELIESKQIIVKYQHNQDVVRFRAVCADGKIYEEIQSFFHAHNEHITRDQAKPICYTAFFGNYNLFELGKLKEEHKKLAYGFLHTQYRGMYDMFKEMKKSRWKENSGKMYANNCMVAQRMESQIFYTVIVPAIWEAGFRDFTTIHDCICTPIKDCQAIMEIMHCEFEKLNIRLQLAA